MIALSWTLAADPVAVHSVHVLELDDAEACVSGPVLADAHGKRSVGLVDLHAHDTADRLSGAGDDELS
ncbi:MAG TPA: hypothetical protein VI997_01575 [Candidatus Thermoplasmatota archaeon]|nr:hypothetical protein [Candidatus Thermoplasmatota archaeon]